MFDAPRAGVYRAWTERADLARWYAPAEGMTLSIDALEVRPGGRYQATLGMPGEVPIVEAGEYREVVPERRLAFDVTLARGGDLFSRTRCTVDFVDRGPRTQLVLTDVDDAAGEHASGWGTALNQLSWLFAG